MKKIIVTGLIFMAFGIGIGEKFYRNKDKISNVFNEGEIYYFLQEGVYTSKEIMEENTKNIAIKAIEKQNDKYYVYLGITKNEKIAKKIKNIYEKKGYQIYLKEVKLNNEEFSSNIAQFDLLLNSTEKDDEILTIIEVILANYEEIIQKSS